MRAGPRAEALRKACARDIEAMQRAIALCDARIEAARAEILLQRRHRAAFERRLRQCKAEMPPEQPGEGREAYAAALRAVLRR